jgi:hypothetical protein|tara:strand:+ start:1016 stop:1414 length:399 start_codon:yes stop_codon:yes gene_type:complete
MADTVVNKTIIDGPRTLVESFTWTYVDTGESAVQKIDASALSTSPEGDTCTGVKIKRIWFSTVGVSVKILWDASTDTLAVQLPTDYQGDLDFSSVGGLVNSASSPTGDVNFTTVGHGAGDTYTVVLECIKNY